jgi:hypothetical protein
MHKQERKQRAPQDAGVQTDPAIEGSSTAAIKAVDTRSATGEGSTKAASRGKSSGSAPKRKKRFVL